MAINIRYTQTAQFATVFNNEMLGRGGLGVGEAYIAREGEAYTAARSHIHFARFEFGRKRTYRAQGPDKTPATTDSRD